LNQHLPELRFACSGLRFGLLSRTRFLATEFGSTCRDSRR